MDLIITQPLDNWLDEYSWPYGKKCPQCSADNTIIDNVCTKCGSDFNTTKCPVCGDWYAKVWDQRGQGCFSCFERKQREKLQEEDRARQLEYNAMMKQRKIDHWVMRPQKKG